MRFFPEKIRSEHFELFRRLTRQSECIGAMSECFFLSIKPGVSTFECQSTQEKVPTFSEALKISVFMHKTYGGDSQTPEANQRETTKTKISNEAK